MKIIEKIKFRFWALSKRFKLIRYFFDLMAIIYSYYCHFKYKKNIKNFFYNKKYSVKKLNDSQFIIIKDKFTSKDKLIGLIHLLNHIGVPYFILSLKDFKKHDLKNFKLRVIICFNFFSELENIDQNKNKIILINKKKHQKLKKNSQLNYCSSKLLPHNDGLLSKFTHSFVKKLLDTNIPIITNYFKSDISIVVDDVKGDFNYNIFLKLKWKILLSIFVYDFFKKEKAIKFRRKIYKFNTFDISPHSMTENEFLYYNFSKGENLSRKNFIKLWKIVKKYFNENSIKMGNIITSHFHLMSKCCVPILLKNNLKYYLCDIEPGKKFIHYNKKFLPYGDPSLATGNSDKKKLFQFYSGNPSQSSKMSHSFYDFLEGNISKEKLLQKIKKNLELLIYSGFPIYLRTHEYNLIKHKHNLKEILIFIDKYIKKENLGIKKVKLSTISENLNKRHSAYIKKINIRQNKLNIFCKKNKNSINIFYKKKIVDYINYKKIKNNYEII